MGNRRKGDVWKYFRKISENAHGKAKVSCTFCGCTYLENATRMSTHLLKCSGYLKLHKVFESDEDMQTAGSSAAYRTFETQVFETTSSDKSGSKVLLPNLQRSYTPVADRIFSQDEEIRENIAKAIYSCGLPLSVMEEPSWINVFKSLKPNFDLPTLNQIETSYLEKEYCLLKSQVDVQIYNSTHFGIKCKGSLHEDINYLYITTPSTIFYKTVPKPSVRNLQDDCICLIDNLIADFGTEKVISIVADSYSGIMNGSKFIEKKYPHVAVYQCVYEAMTLLCDSIISSPSFSSLWIRLEDLKKFIKSVTNEKVPYVLQNFVWIFKKYDRFIIDYLVRIKPMVKDFFLSEWNHEKESPANHFMNEDEFWKPIEEMDKLLQPILSSISKFKDNPPPLNHIIPLFISLQNHFEMCQENRYWDSAQQSAISDILAECQKSVLHPIHFAANFFDPIAKGSTLSLEQQMAATEYAYKLAVIFKNVNDEDCLVDMANYKANEGLWGTDYIWKAVHKLHPISWWNGFCSNTNLSKVTVRLFHLPSTSDGGEGREFSSYDSNNEYLHTLSPTQKDMLTFVSRNLKLIDDQHPTKEHTRSSDNHSCIDQRDTPMSSSEKPIALCIPKKEMESYEPEADFKNLKNVHHNKDIEEPS